MGVNTSLRSSLGSFCGFAHLLFYADPTWLDRILLLVGIICSIGAGVPFPLVGIFFGQLIDDLNDATCKTPTSDSGIQSAINDKILILVYVGIAAFVLIYTHLVCWNLFSQRLAQRIRDRYLKNMLRQDIAFFDNLQAGEVSSRLNGDIQAIETGTSEKVGVFLTCVSFCVTAYIIAFIKDATLAGILISLIPAFLVMNIVGGHYVQKYTTSMSDYFSKASAIASEGLSHIALVHALGANEKLEDKFRGYLCGARKEGTRKALASAVQAGLLFFIAFSANALAYWQGSRKIANDVQKTNGNASVGEIYTVIFILVDGSIVLSQVAPLLPLFGGAIAAFQRLRHDIEHHSTIDSTSETGEMPAHLTGSVNVQDVSFAYPARPEHTVLDGISFNCEAGTLTAIVGLSGSGKSTIAALLNRFYDPRSGSISIDGFKLGDINVRHLRAFVSVVPQEPMLLDRSILENVAHGLVNSSTHFHLRAVLLGGILSNITHRAREGEELTKLVEQAGSQVSEVFQLVQHALDLADATNFVEELVYGLATLVGSSGSLISGGQKQRIALARALVRNPRILILDEATAALDSASEQRIQAAIEKVSKGRTVISIAHRLSTIQSAGNIIVMRTGKIIEQGTHDELMAANGSYADMIRLQSVQSSKDTSTGITERGSNEAADAILENQPPTGVEQGAVGAPDTNPQNGSTASKEKVPEGSIIRTLLPMVRPYILLLFLAFLAATIVGGTYPAVGTVFGNVISSFSPCNSVSYIRSRGLLLSGLFFMLACVEFFANFFSWSLFGLISERLIFKVRVLSFRSLFRQPLQWHESRGRSPSQLLGYITDDGNSVAGFSGSIVGTLFSVVINFIAAITLSHILAWRIAVVCLVTVPLLLGAGFMQLRSIIRFHERHGSAFSKSIGITVEAVSSIRTVAALSLEEEILQTYRRSLKAPRKEMAMQSIRTNVWLAIANSCGNFIYAFAYWWGSKNILEGRYSQTRFFIILMAMLVSAQLWGQLFTLAPEITKATAAMSRIAGLITLDSGEAYYMSERSIPDTEEKLNEKNDVEAKADSPLPYVSSPGVGVQFNHVSFAYPARPNIPVLRSISFSIKPGQFCALVGPSGAGKSTVLALLERFYRPFAGNISVNGFDITQNCGTAFRDDIAYVPQENALFQGSVKFNISLGARPGTLPTDQEIENACRLANIHETIMGLPQGYDTKCGANGSQFSGGQRQRLSIARALVRKPKLLLLDESTSALDAESENALELGLREAIKNKGVTVIAIAHRLRTIAQADVIFLIEAGKVVDQGRHEELIQRSESYRVNALHQMLR